MTNYRVSFFKNLSSCYGKRFKVCQRSIVIRSAHDRDRAIRAAKSQFERLERVGDWTLRADKVEVEAVSEETVGGPASTDPEIGHLGLTLRYGTHRALDHPGSAA